MEGVRLRARLVKTGLRCFSDNEDDVFRMALTRLPVQYRTYMPLKALGFSPRFYKEEMRIAALIIENVIN